MNNPAGCVHRADTALSAEECACNALSEGVKGGDHQQCLNLLSALRSGIAKGAINAAWDAIGEVIKAWATEGHAVAIPGLGSMRFGLRASSVADVNKVGSDLITTRRVIFVPNVDIKDELKRTSINITCYDRNGELVKRVTSSDEGNVEEPEGGDDNPGGQNTGDETPTGGGDPSTGGSGQGDGGGGDDEPGGDDH